MLPRLFFEAGSGESVGKLELIVDKKGVEFLLSRLMKKGQRESELAVNLKMWLRDNGDLMPGR